MSDTIVKKEDFFSLDTKVRLITVEAEPAGMQFVFGYSRYYAIIKNGKVEFTSPLFYGGSKEDVIRNCDSALQVVRQLLADTQFLIGEVVGA
jgi:hypothetical protein